MFGIAVRWQRAPQALVIYSECFRGRGNGYNGIFEEGKSDFEHNWITKVAVDKILRAKALSTLETRYASDSLMSILRIKGHPVSVYAHVYLRPSEWKANLC